jgi:hypothetical protein
MTESSRRRSHSLEDRIRLALERTFVGRAAERAVFRSALAPDTAPFSVLYVHGPGGIGKSALLERFADDAQQAGREVVRVDGRMVGPSPEAFEAAAPGASGISGIVLLVDAFDHCDSLGEWFRRVFLPCLREDAVVVVASRQLPDPGWRADLGGTDFLRVLALRNLAPDQAITLLDRRGVPGTLQKAVLAFASGHPLALSLAADVAATDVAQARPWTPGQHVIETLLSELVGAVPSEAHRHALEVCAHAYTTTEELLHAVLPPDENATELFAWLRGLSFIESSADGVFPHDVARDALDEDLRWRDPHGYEEMHRGIRKFLLDRSRTAHNAAALRTLRALSFLHRHGGVMPDFVTWRGAGEIEETPFSPEDRNAVHALAAEAEGEKSAAIADFWLSRQPGAFTIYRRVRSQEPVAFMAWLRLKTLDDEEAARDPVVAAAWEHSRSTKPLRTGEYLAMARFMVYPAEYQRPSPVSDLIGMRILSEWLRAERLAWSYMVIADPKFWKPQMDYLDHQAIDGTPTVSGRSYTLFAHDWRAMPVESWLDRRVPQELFGPEARPATPAPELAVLSRDEFDAAVREALRSWNRPDLLAANPLVRSRLVVERLGGRDAVEALRDLLVSAVDMLAEDPQAAHSYRVATTAFFRQVPTQEAAAERLSLSLSTYRRHLTRAIEHVCEQLWKLELYGTDSE